MVKGWLEREADELSDVTSKGDDKWVEGQMDGFGGGGVSVMIALSLG